MHRYKSLPGAAFTISAADVSCKFMRFLWVQTAFLANELGGLSVCEANEACSRVREEAARFNSARILDFYGTRLQSPALLALH